MWADEQQAFDVLARTATAYTIDLPASRADGELRIHARQIELDAPAKEAWEERHIAATLARSRQSRTQLFFNALLPLARNGRCDVVVAEGAEPLPLEVDEYPYEAQVFVEERDDEGILVRAELHRGSERLDLRGVTALLPRDDIAFLGARVVRVRSDNAASILSAIVRDGVLEVPPTDARDMLRTLWSACGPRMLNLPPSYETFAGRDLPLRTRAILVTPPREGSRRAPPFAVEVVFDYDGVRVPFRDRRGHHVDFDRKRIVRRDRAIELDAIDELVQAGFKTKGYANDGEAEITLASWRLVAAVTALAPERFSIEADGFRVRPSTTASMSIKSGIDWFDLQANVAFDGVVAPMPAILEAVKRGDGLVRLGAQGTGILPSKWLERLERVLQLSDATGVDDALRFQPAQVALVDEILQEEATISWDGPIAELRRKLAAQAKPALAPTPAGFVGELRDYQRAGVGWMRGLEELGFSGCLADDMGLGKTIQVLAYLAGRKAEGRARGPTLVVAPRSVVHNWLDEAHRFAPSLTAIEHRRGCTRFHGVDLVVTTYALLRNDLDALAKVDFDYVVLDEAHAIKNALSSTAKAARKLVSRSRLALTGTPVENHLGELASIFSFLNPGMLGPSVKATAKRGFDADKEEIARIGRGLSPFLLRRKKSEVLAELPERIEQVIHVELGETQRSLYDRVKKHYRDALLGGRARKWPLDELTEEIEENRPAKQGVEVLAALMRLRQLAVHPALLDPGSAEAGSAKMDALLDHLEPIVASGKKALVFSQFTTMLDLVDGELRRKGVPSLRLDGNTKDRKSVVASFQDDPTIPVFLISLKAGGVGLNLTAAEYVFLLDPWWNPAAEAQAIDRAHRMGQTRSVMAYRLVAVDTIEDRLMDLQQKKRDLVASVFGEHEGLSLRTMTVEDLDALLR